MQGQRQLCAEVIEAVPDLRREFVDAMAVDIRRAGPERRIDLMEPALLVDDDRAAGDITARCKDLDLAAGRAVARAVPGAPPPLAAWMAEPGVWAQARG